MSLCIVSLLQQSIGDFSSKFGWKKCLNHQPASTSGAPGKGDKVAVDVAMDTSACRRPCRAGVGRTSETTTTRRTLRSSSKECGHPTESLTSRNFRNRQASDFNDCNSASAVRPKYICCIRLAVGTAAAQLGGANERQIQRPSRGWLLQRSYSCCTAAFVRLLELNWSICSCRWMESPGRKFTKGETWLVTWSKDKAGSLKDGGTCNSAANSSPRLVAHSKPAWYSRSSLATSAVRTWE